jgi:ferredoxin
MPYIITEPCVGNKAAACVAICPVDAIYEGKDQFFINPDECVDCGQCQPECPVSAIFADEAVPAQWADYGAKSQAFFSS